jgi:3-hydroxyisobutyrate dehydrogenase-like beta-hydroxyacid dehydrogenase
MQRREQIKPVVIEGRFQMSVHGAMSPIGFVGLGKMGSVMAANILRSGRPVIGWDRRPEALAPLAKAGGTAAASLSDFASAPVVFSIVYDDDATRDITFGQTGLLNALKPGAIHVAMASISPSLSRVLSDAHSAKGQHYLAAPVFGRPEAAAAAALMINCSGSHDAYQAVEPILATMGSARWLGTEPEKALLLKIMGNNMIFAAVESVREMFRFLRAGGIKDADAKEILIDKLLGGPIFMSYAQRYLEDPESTNLNAMVGKDNRLCLEAAAAMNVDMPLVRFLHDEIFR